MSKDIKVLVRCESCDNEKRVRPRVVRGARLKCSSCGALMHEVKDENDGFKVETK